MLLPHLGVVVIASLVIFSNIAYKNNLAFADDNLQYSTLSNYEIVFTLEQISQYTHFGENVAETQFALEASQENGYLNKELLATTEASKLEKEYMVQKGDTITTIASKFDMHAASILDRNGIAGENSEKLSPGQKLIIPAKDTSNSKDWLVKLNDKKEQDRQLAIQQENARLAQLAKQKKLAYASNRDIATRSSSSSRENSFGNYTISTGTGASNNGYPYGYCTYYVATRRSVPSNLGNAGQWLYNAKSAGFSTGNNPIAGAIMVSNESWVGHVAYVESVDGDSFTVSEMNYAGFGRTSSRTISKDSPVIKGFIY